MRFPGDFIFRLRDHKIQALVSQSVIPSKRHMGGFRPYAFTEEGVAMLSSVLRSQRADKVNIAIMHAFVKLRRLSSREGMIFKKLHGLENRLEGHDVHIQKIFETIRELMNPPLIRKRRIGFTPLDERRGAK